MAMQMTVVVLHVSLKTKQQSSTSNTCTVTNTATTRKSIADSIDTKNETRNDKALVVVVSRCEMLGFGV